MTDSNLVGTSFAGTNTKDLELQLYIESDDGKKVEGIFEVSCRTGEGLEKWYSWLRQAAKAKKGA